MSYLAELITESESNEMKVTLRVNDIVLTCFAIVCPIKRKQGGFYKVDLMPEMFNEYDLREVDAAVTPSILQSGKDFSCVVIGKLENGAISVSGIKFEDTLLLSDFGYLDGKMVEWEIDRLDVEFLEEVST